MLSNDHLIVPLTLSRISNTLISSLIWSTFTLFAPPSTSWDFNRILKIQAILVLGTLSDVVCYCAHILCAIIEGKIVKLGKVLMDSKDLFMLLVLLLCHLGSISFLLLLYELLDFWSVQLLYLCLLCPLIVLNFADWDDLVHLCLDVAIF